MGSKLFSAPLSRLLHILYRNLRIAQKYHRRDFFLYKNRQRRVPCQCQAQGGDSGSLTRVFAIPDYLDEEEDEEGEDDS